MRPTDVDILRVRSVLGVKEWKPAEAMPSMTKSGQVGTMWRLDRFDLTARVLITVDEWEDGADWIHASMSCHNPSRVPNYYELKLLHRAVFGDGWAYHVFAPPTEHVNIHQFVLHLWGRVDGTRVLPDFAFAGGV